MANVEAGTKGFVTVPLEMRFWSKVLIAPGCWRWRGNKNNHGYGQFYRDGRLVPAHRVSFELTNGPIADGLTIDHLCRNPACVNPAHLEAVTHQENCRRADHTTNNANRKKTHCLAGHEFTAENTLLQNGRRQCRQCRSLRHKQSKLRTRSRAALAKALGDPR